MGFENVVYKKGDETLIVEVLFSADRPDEEFQTMSSQLIGFFGNEVHQKYGRVTDWICIYVDVSAPQLLPVWRAILSTVRPVAASERLAVREAFGAVDLQSRFECVGIVAPPSD